MADQPGSQRRRLWGKSAGQGLGVFCWRSPPWWPLSMCWRSS